MENSQRWSDVAEIVPADRDVFATGDLQSLIRVVPTAPVRSQRRLPERILVAAHQACDLGEHDIAGSLLSILEIVLMQPTAQSGSSYRRSVEGMVAAYERLWHLRHGAGQIAEPVMLATQI